MGRCGERSRAKRTPTARVCRRNKDGMFKEWEESHCGWNVISKGKILQGRTRKKGRHWIVGLYGHHKEFGFYFIEVGSRSSPVAQQDENLALLLKHPGLLLWCGFDPWPRNFHMPWVQPKTERENDRGRNRWREGEEAIKGFK